MRSWICAAVLLTGAAVCPPCQAVQTAAAVPATPLAFPGAQGWAATTPGGRGGAILKVTTLDADGPGSFLEAVSAKGPRVVVFEVGGVIDLGKRIVKIAEPYLTIAGQTAPSPGVTFIRGGFQVTTHDVVLQHIRIRVGDAGAAKKSGWGPDGFSTIAGNDVIVDHCSISWAIDENASMSGPRFSGATPAEWRRNTSHRITFSNNIFSEGLARSTHPKLEHSKGSLIHDNVGDILIVGNLYAHNYERNPLFKGGVRGAIVNNLIYDFGPKAIHYNLMAEEWGDRRFEVGKMVAIGNVARAGLSTPPNVAFVEIGGYGDLQYYGRDNIAVDQIGRPLPMFGSYTTAPAKIVRLKKAPFAIPHLKPMRASLVQQYVLRNAGSRPWDRDADDVRLIADVAEGRGEIIDSQEEVHGYPAASARRRPFNPSDWHLENMLPATPAALDSAARAGGT